MGKRLASVKGVTAMIGTLVLGLSTAILSLQARADVLKPAPPRHLLFNLRVLECDPRGKQARRVLAEPRIITLENRPFAFVCGGELNLPMANGDVRFIPIGLTLKGKPATITDGKLQLDLTLTHTTVGERNQLHTQRKRVVTTIHLDELKIFYCEKRPAAKQMWIELWVNEVKP
jgi:hypothetical protein